MAPQIYWSQPSTYQHGFLCQHLCKNFQWTMAGQLPKTEWGETCNERLSWNLHNYKLPKLVSCLHFSLKFLPHSMIKRSGSQFFHMLARLHQSVCGVAAGLPFLMSFIPLPTALNSDQLVNSLWCNQFPSSFLLLPKKPQKTYNPPPQLILFEIFITQINTIRVLHLSSLHSPEPASVGTCWSLGNLCQEGGIFLPH